VYSVEWEQDAVSQPAALPSEALPFFAERVTVLQVEPRSGAAYDRQSDAKVDTRQPGLVAESCAVGPKAKPATANPTTGRSLQRRSRRSQETRTRDHARISAHRRPLGPPERAYCQQKRGVR
jgi:hypothetical protein